MRRKKMKSDVDGERNVGKMWRREEENGEIHMWERNERAVVTESRGRGDGRNGKEKGEENQMREGSMTESR